MKHKLFSSLSLGVALFALGVTFASGPAYAGFQWVSPAPDASQPPASAPYAAPAPVETMQNFPPAQIIEGVKAAPVADQPVRGFADKVPLSVALRQVLPQDVGFSVAQDVSLGTVVSWKGGSSWRQVLKDLLIPAGLTFKEQGQLIHVVRAADGQSLSAPRSMGGVPSASPKPIMGSLDAGAGQPMSLVPPSDLPTRSLTDRAPVRPSAVESGVTTTSPYILDRSVSAWTANKGETLQAVLTSWCKRANVELSWQAEYDYPLQASASLSGSFEEAVRGLLAGFQDANPQPVGYLHNNQVAGQTVLVVQTRGNNYNE